MVIDVSDVIGEAIRYFKGRDKDTIDTISPVFELVGRLRLQIVVHFSTKTSNMRQKIDFPQNQIFASVCTNKKIWPALPFYVQNGRQVP